MSSNNSVIRLALMHDYLSTSGCIYVDFDFKLTGSSDLHLFANGPEKALQATSHSPVLSSIAAELFQARSGVSRVQVQAFRIIIYASSAVTVASLMKRVEDGIWNAGYRVDGTSPQDAVG